VGVDRLWLARVALSTLCGLQGLATLAIHCNKTHATNPLWPGHARYHVVWQSASVAFMSIVELVLIWWPGAWRHEGFYLASMLAATSPLGFMAAFISRRLYEGALFDANGVPPLRMKILGVVRSIDMNFVVVVTALIALAAIDAIYSS
jgi:hypothetical protein